MHHTTQFCRVHTWNGMESCKGPYSVIVKQDSNLSSVELYDKHHTDIIVDKNEVHFKQCMSRLSDFSSSPDYSRAKGKYCVLNIPELVTANARQPVACVVTRVTTTASVSSDPEALRSMVQTFLENNQPKLFDLMNMYGMCQLYFIACPGGNVIMGGVYLNGDGAKQATTPMQSVLAELGPMLGLTAPKREIYHDACMMWK